MKTFVLQMVCLYMVFSPAPAQVEMTLDECLKYGFANNLEVKRSTRDLAASAVRFRQSFYRYMPSIEMTYNHFMSSGKSLNLETYTWASEDIQQGNLAVNAELQIFQGFDRMLERKMSEQGLFLSSLHMGCEKFRIGTEIIRYYYQVNLLQVDVEIMKNGLADTRIHIRKLQEQITSGVMAKGNLYEMLAQEQKEEISIDALVAALKKEYFGLLHWMGWQEHDSLIVTYRSLSDTCKPVFSIPFVDSMVHRILLHSVVLSEQRAKLDIAKTRIKIQKAYMSPAITLQTGLTTRYLAGAADPEYPSGKYGLYPQLSDNRFMQLAIAVRIPIYDRSRKWFEIRLAEIEAEQMKADIEIARETLWFELMTIKEDIQSLVTRIHRSQDLTMAYARSYQMAVEKYKSGILDLYSLHMAKNNHTNALLELSKCIREYAMNVELLLLYDRFSVDTQAPESRKEIFPQQVGQTRDAETGWPVW